MKIERLEARIAPALVIAANGRTATYDDIDGDHVTLKVSKGNLNMAAFSFLDDQLDVLNLSGGGFDGANVIFTVKKVAGGDGIANVGLINSTNHDLGKVVVKGDLAAILAGDATTLNDPGLISLSARSLGRFTASVATNIDGTLESTINGALGSLKLTGDLLGYVHVTGTLDGKVATVAIGGSVVGGATTNAGSIVASGQVGSVKIGHDVQGGSGFLSGRVSGEALTKVSVHGSLIGGSGDQSGDITGIGIGKLTIGNSIIGGPGSNSGNVLASDIASIKVGFDVKGGIGDSSGRISANGLLGSVTIGGSVIGGDTAGSGHVFGFTVKTVKVAHDLVGGTGDTSGGIQANIDIARVTVGGSVLGGSHTFSGFIVANGNLGVIKIGHDLVGGSITNIQASLGDTGMILAGGSIASVTLGGSIIAGIDNSSAGSLVRNAAILAGDDIGSLTVKGSLLGSHTVNGDTDVVIAARGQDAMSPNLTASSDVAISKITIGNRVQNARILAGYNHFVAPLNGNAQVGTVKVGGDWISSSLVAGVQDGGSAGFGDAGDTIIGSGTIAKIASIRIKGTVSGTPAGGDHFGFVSHTIGLFKAGIIVLPFTATSLEFFSLSLNTSDVTVREIGEGEKGARVGWH
jgi:hypothetical protein